MKNEKGFSLIEVTVAIALMGIVGVAFLSGLSTASKAVLIADERATAESLARSEMEYVRSQDYGAAPWAYELPSGTLPADPPDWWDEENPHTLPEGYDGYIVGVNAEGLLEPGVDNSIQRITIVVYFPSYDAEHLNKKITLEGYGSMQ